ncbi:NAD(P)-dependent oxidoreductase [Vagococcus lutrae]|uniref:NAD(P)-dependent oxidoreductase n=1 Tax=Vagococcus lutrae TaxID=81947 RepID=UPI00288EAF35|nr:NAD(P)-dependent oxidoreductase [Vagococcus lutrae]MDT2812547.1 NAD(P)-dependent oxidoreductase [Vagococcus lutrae]
MKTILVLYPLSEKLVSQLQEVATDYKVVTDTDSLTDQDLQAVEIIIGWKKDIGERVLYMPNNSLKWIQSFSAGVDYFDLAEIARQNIQLTSASGIHSSQITETVMGMLLAKSRGIQQSVLQQTARIWQDPNDIIELAHKKLLIVGTGKIGRHLAKVAEVFELDVYGINRSGYDLPHFIKNYPQEDLLNVVGDMDIVVNILPLTDETHHLFDAKFFKQMKNDAWFINVGRGASVNTNDLLEALRHQELAFAGLDVLEEEPLDQHHPIWSEPNVLITPHIAGNSNYYADRLIALFTRNYHSYMKDGTVCESVVNLTEGY